VAKARSPEPQPSSISSAERRRLTVMICELVGAAALSSRLDPEDLREVITAYHRVVGKIVAGFEGSVGKYMGEYIGEGVLAYFGYPQAHEEGHVDAARRRIDETITMAEASGQTWFLAETHRIAGEIELLSPERNVAKAQCLFERALEIARTQQARAWELRTATSLARLWRDQGKRAPSHASSRPSTAGSPKASIHSI
jgi:class 3 adenylate cyclase